MTPTVPAATVDEPASAPAVVAPTVDIAAGDIAPACLATSQPAASTLAGNVPQAIGHAVHVLACAGQRALPFGIHSGPALSNQRAANMQRARERSVDRQGAGSSTGPAPRPSRSHNSLTIYNLTVSPAIFIWKLATPHLRNMLHALALGPGSIKLLDPFSYFTFSIAVG